MNSRSRYPEPGEIALYLLVAAIVVTATISPAAAEIWGIKTHDPFSAPPSTLFRFDEDGDTFTIVGEISLDGQPVEVDGLAIDIDGALYGFVAGDASGLLITIDPVTAVASAVGMLGGREIRGATFTAARGLIGIDIFESALVKIDPATGQQIGPSVPLTLADEPFVIDSFTDLAVDQNGAAVLCRGSTEIYAVDLVTGAVTFLLEDSEPGEDGLPPAGAGLAFPVDGVDDRLFLYDVNDQEDIFAYDLEPPFERTLVYPNIIATYNAGRGDLASFPGGPVGAPDDLDSAPARPRLLPSFPNPFNPQTTIVFTVPRSQPVVISVHDLGGRQVATLADRSFVAGSHTLSWNGLDAKGNALPSGTYLVHLRTDDGVESRKVTLVR